MKNNHFLKNYIKMSTFCFKKSVVSQNFIKIYRRFAAVCTACRNAAESLSWSVRATVMAKKILSTKNCSNFKWFSQHFAQPNRSNEQYFCEVHTPMNNSKACRTMHYRKTVSSAHAKSLHFQNGLKNRNMNLLMMLLYQMKPYYVS